MPSSPAPVARVTHLRNTILALASGLLLAAPFLHPHLFPAGWVAFVPLLFALRNASLTAAWLLGAVTGVTAWASAHYWMPVLVGNFLGYAAPGNMLASAIYWLYVSQSIALAALLFRWLERRTDWPATVLVPVAFVTVFSLYPLLTPVTLAAGQTPFPAGIQGAAIVGGHGADWVMVLTSALVFQVLRDGRRFWRHPATTLPATVIVAWFTWGLITLLHWDAETAGWDERRVGIVQPDDAPSLSIPPVADGYSRTDPPEMAMTRALTSEGLDFVVWPETRFKGYYRYPQVRLAYQRQVRSLETPLILQDNEGTDEGDFNASVVLDADGNEAARYRKMRRMPFGEFIPLIDAVPLLEPLGMALFGDASSHLAPGTESASARLNGARIVPKICFETGASALVAGAVAEDPAGTVLVFQSMNNWFGNTRQPHQHTQQAVLRGIENRVPVVHAMNNGPSTVSGPQGRVLASTEPFTRTAATLPLPQDRDSGGSFHSRNPHAFLFTLYGAQAMLLVAAVGIGRRRH